MSIGKEQIRLFVFIFCVLFFTQTSIAGSCINRSDSLILKTQSEVDLFPVNFPGCSSINGKLIIAGNNITNLQALNVLTFIGSLNILDNPQLVSINGLNQLKFAGYVNISNNESLLSLNGLEALDSITTSLEIQYNPSLVTLDGLNSLRTVNKLLSIYRNASLLNLDGLESVRSTTRLAVYGNSSLVSIVGIDSMIKLRSVDIWFNESLSCCAVINRMRINNPFLNVTNIFTNSDGCNSAAEIQAFSGSQNCCKTEISVTEKRICEGENIVVGTNIYNSTGLYIDTFQTISNCDSIVYTNLGFSQPSYTIVERDACSGQPFKLSNGTQITTSGIYIDTIPFTCDSVVEYRLNFMDAIRTVTQSAICEGKSFKLPGGYLVSESGTYIDTIRNTGICDSIYTTIVSFLPNSFSVSLVAEVTVNIGDSIELLPTYINGIPAIWTWQPSADLNCLDCESPVVKPFQNTTYEVNVLSDDGCEDTAKINVLVKESDIFIPTAFSPNGDNVNDVLDVFMSSPKIFSLKIFNRYGEMVFYSDTVNSKWNGTYKNEICPSDSYVYLLDAVLFNGSLLQKKGTIALLR